jgi:branched-chain amino acid transport system permease protein
MRPIHFYISFLAAVIVLAMLPLIISDYNAYLIRLMGIYVIVALGLNIFMGYCGQINFGAAAFYAIGAYGTGVLQVKTGLPYLLAFPIAIVLVFLVAWGMSRPLLRLRGHSLAIGTLGLGIVTHLVLERFERLTGGSDGMAVTTMLFDGRAKELFNYYLIIAFALAAYLISHWLVNSPIGRAMKALKEDEGAVEALGSNVHHLKVVAWFISAILGGIAGALYVQHDAYLSPTTFGLHSNINLILMICVGGLASNLGSVIGAIVMIMVPYLLMSMQEFVLLVSGLILFIILRFAPTGIVGIIGKQLYKFNAGRLRPGRER